MQRLGRLEQIAPGSSARLKFAGDSHGHGLCVIREGGSVRSFLNRCPHTGAPMDWVPGQFLDETGHIQCSLHGARFRTEDGYCISGPCAGQSLTAVVVTVTAAGELLLEHPASV